MFDFPIAQPTFSCPANAGMFVKKVKASRHAFDDELVVTTLHMRYPLVIHAELMTHRVFSRNARSSRAVPIMTMINEIRTAPYIPWHWTGHQKGMQGVPGHDEKVVLMGTTALFVDDAVAVSNVAAHLYARDFACDFAESLDRAGYHKQIANRYLAPFAWIDVLVTSTDWANFLHLRDHPAAEPHMRDLALLVGQALEHEDDIEQLVEDDWHLPYITSADQEWVTSEYPYGPAGVHEEILCKISAARCARISYVPFDGNPSYERELERYGDLTKGDTIHASPLEHQCQSDEMSWAHTRLFSSQDDAETPGAKPYIEIDGEVWDNAQFHGNLHGFIQYRKTVPGEFVAG